MQSEWDRRTLLRAGIGGLAVGSAGCLGVFESDSNDVDVSGLTFEFTYGQVDSGGAVTIEHTGDAEVPAGALHIRTDDGDSTVWSELGSTTEQPDEAVTAGSTARIGPEVVNWPSAVASSETVRVLYSPEESSVTELNRYSPPTPTPAPTPTPSPTPTATPSPTPTPTALRVTGFEGGDLSEWTVADTGATGSGDWTVTDERTVEGDYAARYQGDKRQIIVSRSGLERYPTRGDTFSFHRLYTDEASGGGFGFGVQSDSFDDGYQVRIHHSDWESHPNTVYLATRIDGEKNVIARAEYDVAAYAGRLLQWELDWGEPTIRVHATDADGAHVLTLEADDSTFDEGGIALSGNSSSGSRIYCDSLEIASKSE